MGHGIDEALARLSSATPHPRLAGLEDRVLGALAASQPSAGFGAGAALVAASLALLLGLASNVVPTMNAQAASSLSPLGVPSPLAPSTLLAGIR